jgi:ribosomal RNA-processing protein 9
MVLAYLYSGSKDGSIVKWDFWTGAKLHVFPGGLKPTKRLEKRMGKKKMENQGHNNNILTMDASSDGRFIVSSFCNCFGL